MEQAKQETGNGRHFHEELFSLVMDAIAPWALSGKGQQGRQNWAVRNITIKDDQAIVCVKHVNSLDQYTALICCLNEPEVIGVSFTEGNLGMLNPYLDCGHKLEADLDGPGCWNVLAITFVAEPGAETVRYLRNGEIMESHVNEFGAFSIIDWESNLPVEEYLAVKINGEWKTPVVAAIPYTIDYVIACWRKAVYRDNGLRSRWNRWITAAFVELCGSDRATLQNEMMNRLAEESNQQCYMAFKQERRRFLELEKKPLNSLSISA